MMAGLTDYKDTSSIGYSEKNGFASDSDSDSDIHESVDTLVNGTSYSIKDPKELPTRSDHRHPPCATAATTSPTLLGSAGRKKRSPSVTTPRTEIIFGKIFSAKGAELGERLLRIARGGATPLQRVAARRQLVSLGGPYAVLGRGSPFSVWMRPSPLNHNVIALQMQRSRFCNELEEQSRNGTTLKKRITMPRVLREGALWKSRCTSPRTRIPPDATNLFSMEASYSEKFRNHRCIYPLTPGECFAVSLLAMEYSEEDEDAHTVDLGASLLSCTRQESSSNLICLTEEHYVIDKAGTGKEPMRGAVNEFISPYDSHYHYPSISHQDSLKNCLLKRPRKGFSDTETTHFSTELSHKSRVARKLDYSISYDKKEYAGPLVSESPSASLTATVIERQNYRILQNKLNFLSINY